MQSDPGSLQHEAHKRLKWCLLKSLGYELDCHKVKKSFKICHAKTRLRCLEMKLHLQPGSCSSSHSQARPLEGAQVESRVHEPLQLIEVGGFVPCRRSSCRVPPHVPVCETQKVCHQNLSPPPDSLNRFRANT